MLGASLDSGKGRERPYTEDSTMSLEAVVYRGRRNLKFDPEQAGAALDARTGEYYFQDTEAERRFGDAVIAVDRHLGNVSTVQFLSDAVAGLLGRRDTLLQARVLFDGTHAGDAIDPGQFQELASELAEIRKSSKVDQLPEISEFVRNMEDLVKAATEEGNPIVFT
jgi:hypothetical protein